MPDARRHRGPHPEDAELFAPGSWPVLQAATGELSWLLSRGYPADSALKLVGDRHSLHKRQRIAVARAACSDQALHDRAQRMADLLHLAGVELWIDGYNVLTTVEAALAGGIILHARDHCFRDMASMHGSYRKVQETIPALQAVGYVLEAAGHPRCRWLLDSPVSNSGRLKILMQATARQAGWDWQVELVANPDSCLGEGRRIAATSDSQILDRCHRWVNLARRVVETAAPDAFIVPMFEPA